MNPYSYGDLIMDFNLKGIKYIGAIIQVAVITYFKLFLQALTNICTSQFQSVKAVHISNIKFKLTITKALQALQILRVLIPHKFLWTKNQIKMKLKFMNSVYLKTTPILSIQAL